MVVVVTILPATPTPTTAQSLLPPRLALPGCPDHCGNLTIPYPFGIGDGCYLRRQFNITCNYSTQPPTAFLITSNLEITNISPYDGELQMLQSGASDCYDARGNSTEWSSAWFDMPPPYTISETKNVFVAVGCDTLAFFIGYRDEEEYTTGYIDECKAPISCSMGTCINIPGSYNCIKDNGRAKLSLLVIISLGQGSNFLAAALIR
ncbi:hypothetical protein C1H46_037332 [Malus baccata]|uniref:Wall-associated receptor kinase galacturonan-binding domain-containing protein n=1 Tax=Malus baccata TaxID=106549 RepID=A0A540KSE5_MALBA|nr:hypothetical protein C1H46_037332 [Malus baccata]